MSPKRVFMSVRFGAGILVAGVTGVGLVRDNSLVLTSLSGGCSLHLDRRNLKSLLKVRTN